MPFGNIMRTPKPGVFAPGGISGARGGPSSASSAPPPASSLIRGYYPMSSGTMGANTSPLAYATNAAPQDFQTDGVAPTMVGPPGFIAGMRYGAISGTSQGGWRQKSMSGAALFNNAMPGECRNWSCVWHIRRRSADVRPGRILDQWGSASNNQRLFVNLDGSIEFRQCVNSTTPGHLIQGAAGTVPVDTPTLVVLTADTPNNDNGHRFKLYVGATLIGTSAIAADVSLGEDAYIGRTREDGAGYGLDVADVLCLRATAAQSTQTAACLTQAQVTTLANNFASGIPLWQWLGLSAPP